MVTRWLSSILLCVCLICFLSGTWSRSAARAQDRSQRVPEVLLLEGNRVMRGYITVGRETLSVEQDGAGIVIVPKAQVRFQGPDMHSIYVFLLDGLGSGASADDHVRLARWCITYKMLPEARFELETALTLEPGRDDIRRNLATLDSFAKRTLDPVKAVKSQSPAQRRQRMLGMGEDEVESLGGLSREAGQQFTTRVQPILMRNCTNSACHGPLAEHPLKFTIVRLGSNTRRSASERNLLALLKYVDREHLESSPLWIVLTTNHGAQGSSIFTGLKSSEQLQTCKDWVLSITKPSDPIEDRLTSSRSQARSQSRATASERSEPRIPGNRVQFRSREQEEFDPSESDVEPSSSPSLRTSVGSSRNSTLPDQRTRPRTTSRMEELASELIAAPDTHLPEVEPIVARNREPIPELPLEDAFDPEVFNRRQRMKRENDE